jgi:hypothetical protein
LTSLLVQFLGSPSLFVVKIFPETQALIDYAIDKVPRCLTTADRQKFFLDPEPPRWCITGGRESERDPSKWNGKWPYNTGAWRNWLIDKDAGKTRSMPGSDN